MIKLVKNTYKINTHTTSLDLEGYTLKCGDRVIYYKDVGYPIRGWYLGKSESGKTNYILTTSDGLIKPYYNVLKYDWKDIVPDSRYPSTFEYFKKALETLAVVQQP